MRSLMTHAGPATAWLLAGALLSAASAHAADAPRYNQIHLQAQSSMTVDNDRMQALLSTYGEGEDSTRLADQLNATMAWALKSAKKFPHVLAGSGQYQTYPVYQKSALKRWRATQELQLESGDYGELTQLLGVLQERMQVNAMRFFVSPQRRSQAEDELIDQALAAFQARAERVRKDLGAKSYRIVELNVGSNSGVIPPPMMRANVAESSVTAPAVEAGRSTLTVSAEGTIELQH